jgi:hypothetical protein
MTTITNNFNDVNNLLRLAYDFYYNPNKTLCYDVKPINLQDVEDYKSIKRVYNKNQTYMFVNNFLNDKIVFVKKIMTLFGNKFIFKKINDPYSVNLSIFIYNTGEQNNLSSPQNINKIFLKLFSDFLSYDQTKHILLQILNVDVGLVDIEDFFVNSGIQELKELLNTQNINNKVVSIGITEHFFKLVYLDDFLNENTLSSWDEESYKALIFQILFTLTVIQNKYPNFRHNNLILKNMEGYIKSINKSKDKYTLSGINYEIKNIGFTYKMSNFENATIVDVIINDQLDNNLRKIDKMYDINNFLKNLKNHLISKNITIPDKTLNFLNIEHNYVSLNMIFQHEYFENTKMIKMSQNKNVSRSIKENGKNQKNIRPNKINKQDIIENKISNQNLSEDMGKQSFLFKGNRNLNIDTSDSKEKNIDTIISGVRKITNVKTTDDIDDSTFRIKKIHNNETKQHLNEDSIVEEILGIKTKTNFENLNQNFNINNQKKQNKLASVFGSTNEEIMKAQQLYPNEFNNASNLVPNNYRQKRSSIDEFVLDPKANIGTQQINGMASIPSMQHVNTQQYEIPSINQQIVSSFPNKSVSGKISQDFTQNGENQGIIGMQMPPMSSMSMPQMPPMNMGMPQMPPMNMGMPQMPPMNMSMPQMPPMNMSMPQMPPMNMGMPPMNMGMPHMNMGMPHMNMGMPHMNMSIPSTDFYNEANQMYGGNIDYDENSLVDTDTFFFRQKITK